MLSLADDFYSICGICSKVRRARAVRIDYDCCHLIYLVSFVSPSFLSDVVVLPLHSTATFRESFLIHAPTLSVGTFIVEKMEIFIW